MYTIYKHTNMLNNKAYIGQTSREPKNRWLNGRGYKTQPVFWRAISKYGWINFKHEILETNILTKEEADHKEIYYIKYYHTYINDKNCWGYNMTPGGKDHTKFFKYYKNI